METTPVHTLNQRGVLSESKRIILSNYTHFLALAVLFLPLIITPTLYLSPQFFNLHLFSNLLPNPVFYLLYIPIAYVLALCAISTISYSSYNCFLGKPVKFSLAFNSLTSSFFPLLSTAIVAHVLQFLIALSFLLLVGAIVMLGQNLGFVIDYNSVYFMVFSAIMGSILVTVMIYFQVNWSLAYVVAVVESKWGFGALIRSSYLVKGMRSVSLLLLLYFGVFGWLLVLVYSGGVLHYEWSAWGFVFYSMLCWFFLMMILARSSAANTVLYMYCKALHGELAIEIGHHYINLPSDDEKVPHIVSIVPA